MDRRFQVKNCHRLLKIRIFDFFLFTKTLQFFNTGQCCIVNQTWFTKFSERTKHLFKKYISHFILERGPQFFISIRDRWRDIYSDRGLLLVPYLLPEPGDVNVWTPLEAESSQTPLTGCVSLARLPIFWTLSKSDCVVIMWSPSGYTPVRLDCPDALSSFCLLIITWQLVKGTGVTRNEPKIHVICYITVSMRYPSLTFVPGPY